MTLTWTKEMIQDQSGKVVIITGGDSNLGYETAFSLAEKGATVILAVSDLHKGRMAQEKIQSLLPDAKTDVMYLDLNDINSIKAFANQFKQQYHTLSILINNAEIISPKLKHTKNGFESHFGVNFIGHFVLTCLLLDVLKKTENSRVISIGTKLTPKTKLEFGYFKGSNPYKKEKFYLQSKLANMLFAKLLQQKFNNHGIRSYSIACYPGLDNSKSKKSSKVVESVEKIRVKSDEQETIPSALPILYAATEKLSGGELIGPSNGKKGNPKELKTLDDLYDEYVASNLWYITEKLSGIAYRF
nr:SDR family NAD(P)-dependent oxidoreductase [Lysinibacillus timonensis]